MNDLNIRYLESELDRVTEERDAYAVAIANASALASEWEESVVGGGKGREGRLSMRHAAELRAALAKGAPAAPATDGEPADHQRGTGPHPVTGADVARAARAVAQNHANDGRIWSAFHAFARALELGRGE